MGLNPDALLHTWLIKSDLWGGQPCTDVCLDLELLGWLQYAPKVREERREVTQSCPTLCDPVDCSPPVSSVHGILQARILEWVAMDHRILQNTNTGVGCHFLLQGIVLTQGSNLGLLHCRQSLDYLLSHQGLQYWSAEWWGDEDARTAGGEGWKDTVNSYIHHSLCVTLLPCPHSFPPSLPLSGCGSHFWVLWKC